MALYPSPTFQNVVLLEEPTIGGHAATKTYVDGRAAVSATKALTLIMSGVVGAAASDVLYAAPPFNLLVLSLTSVAAIADRNYILELFDGNPNAAGTLVYQASGITAATYTDTASFFVPMPTSLYARITNIDSVPTSANITLRYVGVT